VAVTRAERVTEVRSFLAQGLNAAAIAKRLGLSRSYVTSLISDPEGVIEDARRQRSAGKCMDCGGPTRNGGARAKPSRCAACARAQQVRNRHWTREEIIAAFREFHERMGYPPTVTDASEAHARQSGQPGRALRHGIKLPRASFVSREFGSWGAAVKAAGFEWSQTYERTPEFRERMRRKRTGFRWRWPREKQIECAHVWKAEHGRFPRSTDWMHPGDHPNLKTVQDEFGSWTGFILECERGNVPREDRRAGTMAAKYVVLRRTSEGLFEELATVGSENAAAALNEALDGKTDAEGEYTVVPIQWWQPRRVRAVEKIVWEWDTVEP
jgi:hypothetical protein